MGDNLKEADNLKETDNLERDNKLKEALPNEPKVVGCNVCMLVAYDDGKEKLNKFEKAYKQREEREEREEWEKFIEEWKKKMRQEESWDDEDSKVSNETPPKKEDKKEIVKSTITPCDVDWDDPNGGWEIMTNIIPYNDSKKKEKDKKDNKYKNMYGF